MYKPVSTSGRTTAGELRLKSATRKSLNEQIGELHTQVVDSAYEKIIYKEGRDIVEENELSYASSVSDLDYARRDFRELNRKLRKASFETVVEFEDE